MHTFNCETADLVETILKVSYNNWSFNHKVFFSTKYFMEKKKNIAPLYPNSCWRVKWWLLALFIICNLFIFLLYFKCLSSPITMSENSFKWKCRQYSVEYLNFGFITPNNEQQPMCRLCKKSFFKGGHGATRAFWSFKQDTHW